jgi:hypothetical protein
VSAQQDDHSVAHLCARLGRVQLLEWVVSIDASVLSDSVTSRGDTALHTAVAFGQLGAARFLLDTCPSLIEVVNEEGRTALATCESLCTPMAELCELLHEAHQSLERKEEEKGAERRVRELLAMLDEAKAKDDEDITEGERHPFMDVHVSMS